MKNIACYCYSISQSLASSIVLNELRFLLANCFTALKRMLLIPITPTIAYLET